MAVWAWAFLETRVDLQPHLDIQEVAGSERWLNQSCLLGMVQSGQVPLALLYLSLHRASALPVPMVALNLWRVRLRLEIQSHLRSASAVVQIQWDLGERIEALIDVDMLLRLYLFLYQAILLPD